MLAQATLAIAVCSEKEKDGSPHIWWEQDCAAAMQNILVAATALGLGSVWIGVNHAVAISEKVREIVDVPEHIHIMGMAAIGYAAESRRPRSGVDQERVHKERW
jgi:nitroreductase